MRNNIISFIFFFLAFTKLNAKNLDIEATKISLDKVNQTTVFENNVKIITEDGNKIYSDLARYDKKQNFIVLEKNIKAIDPKNNIIETDYAEYDESKKIFKTKGYTKITTSENYIIISESVIFDNFNRVVTSEKKNIFKRSGWKSNLS